MVLAILIALGLAVPSYLPAPAYAQAASMMAASASSCAPGETYVKSYKKADGTVVSGYCRHSAESSKDCAKGEVYVHSYKKADGTEVKGYCRKQPSPTASRS